MKHRNQKKRVYLAPQATPSEVLFEHALLNDSARMLLYIDELENINATAGETNEGDFYFDIYEF